MEAWTQHSRGVSDGATVYWLTRVASGLIIIVAIDQESTLSCAICYVRYCPYMKLLVRTIAHPLQSRQGPKLLLVFCANIYQRAFMSTFITGNIMQARTDRVFIYSSIFFF